MIAFSGMIGIGKTTYATRLAKSLGTDLFLESVDENPILDKYYEDRERYGFVLQIYFLNKRLQSIKDASNHSHNVLDRSIYEDQLFINANQQTGEMTQEEYDIYLDLVANMMEEIEDQPTKAPELLIYLDGSFDRVLANIKKRGRDYEQVDEDDDLLAYYKRLYDLYDPWFESYDESPKLRIDTSDYDILNKEEDWEEVFGIIQDKLNTIA